MRVRKQLQTKIKKKVSRLPYVHLFECFAAYSVLPFNAKICELFLHFTMHARKNNKFSFMTPCFRRRLRTSFNLIFIIDTLSCERKVFSLTSRSFCVSTKWRQPMKKLPLKSTNRIRLSKITTSEKFPKI